MDYGGPAFDIRPAPRRGPPLALHRFARALRAFLGRMLLTVWSYSIRVVLIVAALAASGDLPTVLGYGEDALHWLATQCAILIP